MCFNTFFQRVVPLLALFITLNLAGDSLSSGNKMTRFFCSSCVFNTSVLEEFCHHCQYHIHEKNFRIFCSVRQCPYAAQNIKQFKMHIRRKHPIQNDVSDCSSSDDENNNAPLNVPEKQQNLTSIMAAKFTLSLETEHKLSQKGTDDTVSAIKTLVGESLYSYKIALSDKMKNRGISTEILDEVSMPETLTHLSTQHSRNAFYVSNMKLINPSDIVLYREYTIRSGVKNHIGYVIPFERNLQSFLSLPEVWREVQSEHRSTDDFMRDICDGSYVRNHLLFHTHPSALQIILYTDDIEIVNPIGSHTTKHKLTMFYFTLANISTKFRSALSAIQLLAVAKTHDLRSNAGSLEKLLGDFIATVNKLQSTGIEFDLFGSRHTVFGSLVCVPCDSLASNWLGGFKESSSFAYKGCRTCKASNTDMKSASLATIDLRPDDEHRRRCEALSELTPASRKYWSKMWGINNSSPLLHIQNFHLCSLVHDPMHIFLEGVVPYEISLLLFNFIYVERYFTLKFLNQKIKSFVYTYLDKKDAPEAIGKEHIVCGKLKQTAAAVMVLCCTLPFMIGNSIPDGNEVWLNFLRLVRIMLICTSPYCNNESVAILEMMITTHHTNFVKLYPKSPVTPKMHYMLHLPRQMSLYGPLRSTWCMRFEAKHSCFKGKKWKNFKNLPLSVATFHQKLMCSRLTSGYGQPSENFLYAGDSVKIRCEGIFSQTYPNLRGSFLHLCGINSNDAEPRVYFALEVNIHGHKYKPGCGLVTAYDEEDMPQLVKLHDIVIHDDDKYFVVQMITTTHYNDHLMSYMLNSDHDMRVLRHSDLFSVWPQSLYRMNNDTCFVNRYSHTCEFP